MTSRVRPWPHRASAALWLALTVACPGCGGDDALASDAGPDSGARPDAGAIIDAALDSAVADSGIDHAPSAREASDALVSLHLGIALADSLFDFDPTIDPAATAAANATAIGANVRVNLGTCGTVMVTGTSVMVDFGAAPGCALATGLSVSGSVAADVSRSAATTIVAVGIASVTVQGRALTGTLTFTTTDGSSFMLAATGGGATGLLTVAGAAGTFTVAGTLTIGSGMMPTGVTLTDVAWHRGDCYPSAGSVRITHGFLMQTIAFSASTAMTGTCDRTVVGRTTSYVLPAYGSCPAGTVPDAGTDPGVDAGSSDAAVADASAADAGPSDAGSDSGIDAGG